jgi:hypothetical protein
VRRRLDARQRGSREAARHELAVDEQGIRRAIDEVAAVRLFVEHAPRRADRPAQQRARAFVIDNRDSGQLHVFRNACAVDHERLSIGHADDADHRRFEAERNKESDEGEES